MGNSFYRLFVRRWYGMDAGAVDNGNPKIIPDVSSASSKEKASSANYEKLITICNYETRGVTAESIRNEHFRRDELEEPNIEVCPQMRKVNKNDYYVGRYSMALAITNFETFQNKPAVKQLKNLFGFLIQDGVAGKSITFNNAVASICRRESSDTSRAVGITAIIASAGSGKTFLTRRIAQQALGLFHAEQEIKDIPLSRPEMVRYIELKDIQDGEAIKLSTFLFGGLYQTESEEDDAYEWLVSHQSEAIIFFDGLDQANWHFDKYSRRKMNKYDTATAATIMYNILSRHLLTHTKFVVASREFKVSDLPEEARPENIITLNGLTLHDARTLFISLLGRNGVTLWNEIEIMPSWLHELICIPVFLVLTANAMRGHAIRQTPATVTELYQQVISDFQDEVNSRNQNRSSKITDGLKTMALEGLAEGRGIFDDTDMIQYKISASEVQDLMTKLPGQNLLSRHLSKGNFIFVFCHKSIQEFLAATAVAEMECNDFARFVDAHLHKTPWHVVRRFVSGIIFSKSPNKLHEVTDQSKKKRILSQSFLSQLEETQGSNAARVELYAAVHESNDDNLIKNISAIDLSGISLSLIAAHIVGSLTARSEHLDYLNLRRCFIDDEILGIFAKHLKHRIQADKVDLRGNRSLSTDALMSFLGNPNIESLSGYLDWRVLKLTTKTNHDVKLTNNGDIINIKGKGVSGNFNIKESKFIFDRSHWLAHLIYFSRLFKPDTIESCDGVLYVTMVDLREISDTNIEEVEKMLLDCTEDKNIDWALIKDFVWKYWVDSLEIAASGKTSTAEYDNILKNMHEISQIGVRVNIHWVFVVRHKDEVGRILEDCEQKKCGFIRCRIEYRASLDDIHLLVLNCKTLKLIYEQQDHMLQGADFVKFQEISRDLNIEFQVSPFDPNHPETCVTSDIIDMDDGSNVDDQSDSDEDGDGIPYKRVTKYIGPAGGRIGIYGCSVIFPPDCFDTMQKVSFKASINSKIWPTGERIITPTIMVEAPELLIPATVILTTWCVGSGKDSLVKVFRQEKDKNSWDVVHACQLGTSREIRFELDHFSTLIGVLWNYMRGLYPLLPCVGYNKHQFAVATCFVGKDYEQNCREKMMEVIGKDLTFITYNTIKCKTTDNIGIKLSFPKNEPDFLFTPCEFKHSVNRVSDGGGYFVASSLLQSKEKVKDIPIMFQLFKNGDEWDKQAIPYHWIPDGQSLKIPEESLPPQAIAVGGNLVMNIGDKNVGIENRGQMEVNKDHCVENLGQGGDTRGRSYCPRCTTL